MTILVTGGAGYIGSHVVLRLSELGHPVVVLDDLSAGARAAIPSGAPLIVGRIQDEALVAQIIREHGVSAVMHFAGSVVVEDSVRDPGAYYRNNTCGTLALLQACLGAGVDKVIFSSTAAVYGNVAAAPVSENAPKAPVSPYGRSKLMSEQMIGDLAASGGLRFAILRYFNVAGADPQLRNGLRARNATHLIKIACEVATGRRPHLPVFGDDYPTRDGTCIRDFIHVADLADIHVAALRHLLDGGASGIYNCGYGVGFSVREVADAFGRVLGRPLPMRIEARRPGDPVSVVADPALAKRTFGWAPRHDSIDTIVRTALEWERKMLGEQASEPGPG